VDPSLSVTGIVLLLSSDNNCAGEMVGCSNGLTSSMAAVTAHHLSGSIVVNSVRSIVTEAAELVSPVNGLGSVSKSMHSAGDVLPRGFTGLRASGTENPFWLNVFFRLAFSDFSTASLSLNRRTSFSSSRIYPCVRCRCVLGGNGVR
jgi:hypothetical protein